MADIESILGRGQASLRDSEIMPTVGLISPIRAVYVNTEVLSVEPPNKLWVNRHANVLSAAEALLISQMDEPEDILFRLIALPHRRIADFAGDFVLDEKSGDRLPVNTVTHHTAEDWMKITGIIRTPEERQGIQNYIANKYRVNIGESVLTLALAEIEEELLDEIPDIPEIDDQSETNS